MHEVGIMEGAINMALKLMSEQNGSRLRAIHMTVGSLSSVVPQALDSAFLSLRAAYGIDTAKLHITWVEATCFCTDCQCEFSFDQLGYICPHCHEPAFNVSKGKELELTRVEWE